MRFPALPSRRSSAQCLTIVASYLNDVWSKITRAIFGSAAHQNNALDELHSAMIKSAIKFATHVTTWGSSFIDKPLEPAYDQLFQREIEHSARCYFNQLLLTTEAVCFFLHALNNRLERFGSKAFRSAIYDSSVQAMIRWLIQNAVLAFGRKSHSLSEEAFNQLIKTRGIEYAQSPSLFGNGSDDQSSAVWMAALKISDEVSIKDSFDREGYPNHTILTHIVGTVLILESEALDLTARIERISESEELSACFAPTTDRPQRLIDSAARLDTNTRIADQIPDVSPTPLQRRIQRAFFLLRIKVGQWDNKSPVTSR